METQELFNVAVGGLFLLVGWVLRILWDSLRDLKQADKALVDKVGRIEVLVAGEYVKRSDFDKVMFRLFEKLDHIESKIDNKADK